MKILVVNVNTTASMTETIVASARSVASSGTEIVGLTPTFGAESVEGNFESYLAAVGVMDAVTRYQGEFDAVVQAGFGEHGREGLQELSMYPSSTSQRRPATSPRCSATSIPSSRRSTVRSRSSRTGSSSPVSTPDAPPCAPAACPSSSSMSDRRPP